AIASAVLTLVLFARAQPHFVPTYIPPVVYPGVAILFPVKAVSTMAGTGVVTYQLLSPTNFFDTGIDYDRGEAQLAIFFFPQKDDLGTSFNFVVRATDTTGLSATNAFQIRVDDPPPIRSIQISNNVAILTM